jgi:hypothetical protein
VLGVVKHPCIGGASGGRLYVSFGLPVSLPLAGVEGHGMIVGGGLVNDQVALTLGSRIGKNRSMIVLKSFLADVFARHRIPGDIIRMLPDLGSVIGSTSQIHRAPSRGFA